MALTLVHNRNYAAPVTANSVAGIGVLESLRPHRPRTNRGFFVRDVQHPSYGRLDGGLFGGAGFRSVRYANSVQSPTLIGVRVGGFKPQHYGATPMANPIQATPGALNLAAEAYDAVTLAAGMISNLASLFIAIGAAEKFPSQAKRLADVGQYLADDWGGLLDAQAESLESLLNSIRSEGKAA